MICYVDSSIVLEFLLVDYPAFKEVFEYEKAGSSELLIVESCRVFERYRLRNLIDDDQLADLRQKLDMLTEDLHLLQLSPLVLRRASAPFPTVIGALDAIHLASALLWKESEPENDLAVFSLDRRMTVCAQSLGFHIHRV